MKKSKNLIIGIFLTLMVINSVVSNTFTTDPVTPMIQEDEFDKEIAQLHLEALEALENKGYSKKYFSQMEEFLKNLEPNSCTNGKNPVELSPSQYIREFAAGPCNPTVISPGIMGSKLVAKIDCEKLLKNDPTTFADCGWNGCNKIIHTVPKPEYLIWVPALSSPASIIKPFGPSKKCFSGLMGLKLTGAEDEIKISPKDGVTIDTLGSTPVMGKTVSKGKCGFDAIGDIMPTELASQGTAAFAKWIDPLLKVGYKFGVTVQALPYDFRIDTRENLLNQKFGKVVNDMNEMFGKKVVIVAHSMGNLQVANYLWNLDQEEKDKKIARYIAIAPSYLGAIKPVIAMLGMDSSLSFNIIIGKIGLTEDFYLKCAFKYKGMFNLFPQNIFKAHKDKNYMKAIMQKIQAEKDQKDMPKGTVMDIFPSVSEKCVPGMKSRPDNCITGLRDFTEFGSVQGKTITYDSMFEILKDHSHSEHAPYIYKQTIDERFTEYENLGVQTNIIFSTNIPTYNKAHYFDDPRTKTKDGQFYDPDQIENAPGDGSVLSSVALVPGIKWADEFRNKKENAKPVTFVEVCGTFNQKESIFQDGKTVVKNEYMGVDCSCRGSAAEKSEGTCARHADMVEEPRVISFILESMMDGVKGEVGGRFKSMTDGELNVYESYCEMFNEGF